MYGQSGSSLGNRGSNNGASCPSQRRTSHGDRVSFGSVREESPRALQQEMEQEQKQEQQMQPVPRDLAEVSASELSEGVGIGPISPLTRVHVPVIEEAAAVEVAYDDDDAASEASVEATAVEMPTHAAEVEARPSLDQEESSKPASPLRASIPRLSLPGSSPRRSTLEEASPMTGSQQFRGSNCFAAEL